MWSHFPLSRLLRKLTGHHRWMGLHDAPLYLRELLLPHAKYSGKHLNALGRFHLVYDQLCKRLTLH